MSSIEVHSDYPFYAKVVESAGRNVTYSVIGLFLTWLLARFFLLGAKVMFWIGIVLNGLNSMQVLALTAIGLAAFLGGRRESRWVWAANCARLIEVVVCGVIMWVSAAIVGYK
jgi:hypothetical protein